MKINVEIVLSLLAYLVANIFWFSGEAYAIKNGLAGNYQTAVFWGFMSGICSFPLSMLAAYFLYKNGGGWLLTQAPSIILNVVVSYFAFRSVFDVSVGWREFVSAGLILAAAFLMSLRPEITNGN